MLIFEKELNIDCLVSLERLVLSGNRVSSLHSIQLPEGVMKRLKVLDISSNQVDDPLEALHLFLLEKLPALEALFLHHNPMSGTSIESTEYRSFRCCLVDLIFPALLSDTLKLRVLDSIALSQEDSESIPPSFALETKLFSHSLLFDQKVTSLHLFFLMSLPLLSYFPPNHRSSRY